MLLEDVFNCIKNNPYIDIATICKKLNISNGVFVLAATEELQQRNLVKLKSSPLGQAGPDNSCFYIAAQDSFEDKSKYCHCKKHMTTSDCDSSEFGYYDVCYLCGKRLENGFHYYNHYDGEDHEDFDLY